MKIYQSLQLSLPSWLYLAICARFHLHSGSSTGSVIPAPLRGLYGCVGNSGRKAGGAFPHPATV